MGFCPAVDEVKPSPSSRIQVFAVEHLSPDESDSSPEGFLMVWVKTGLLFLESSQYGIRKTQICKVPKERMTRNHWYGNNINLQIPSCPNMDPWVDVIPLAFLKWMYIASLWNNINLVCQLSFQSKNSQVEWLFIKYVSTPAAQRLTYSFIYILETQLTSICEGQPSSLWKGNTQSCVETQMWKEIQANAEFRAWCSKTTHTEMLQHLQTRWNRVYTFNAYIPKTDMANWDLFFLRQLQNKHTIAHPFFHHKSPPCLEDHPI